MQQFVAKILNDELHNAYELYPGVAREMPTPASTDALPYTAGCLFTVHCRSTATEPTAEVTITGMRSASTSQRFDLDHEERAFQSSSLGGSFSTPSPMVTGMDRSHAIGGMFAFEMEDKTLSPAVAALSRLPLSVAAEDFIVWASLDFLRRLLPRVAQRVEDSASSSRASSYTALSDSTAGSSGSSNENGHAVLCVRAVDVLAVDVAAHHVTARDRRIHVVTLRARDHSSNHGTGDGRGGVGCHRLLFTGGGMTRFLRALRSLAPHLALPASMKRTDVTAAATISTSTAAHMRLEESVNGASESPPRAGRSDGGKGWRARWPTSLFSLRKHSTSEPHMVPSTRTRAASPSALLLSLPPPQQQQRRQAETSASGGINTPPSSESSYLDLGELEGSRDLVPKLRFEEDTRVRLSQISSGQRSAQVTAPTLSPTAVSSGAPTGTAMAAFSILGPGCPRCALAPLTEEVWNACFEGPERVLNYRRFEEARETVFRCGVAPCAAGIRFEVWLYLLDIFTPSTTREAREILLTKNRNLYDTLTMQWTSMLPEQEANFRAFKDRKQAVEKDVLRTDRSMAVYHDDNSPQLRVLQRVLMAHIQLHFDEGYSQGMSDVASVAVVLAYQRPRRPSLAAVTDVGTTVAPAGSRAPSSSRSRRGPQRSVEQGENTGPDEMSEDASRDIDNGVVREGSDTGSGATPDRGSPRDVWSESAAFLCFRAIIAKHMAQNFSMDPVRGMPVLLQQVRVLVRHFAPDVYAHLRGCLSDDMTFCFRWLLMCFKREFATMDEAMRLWDTIFGCPFTTHFEVVIAAALIVKMGTQIMGTLHSCDMVLKFANNLAGNVRVEDVLRCAVEFYEDTLAVGVAQLETTLHGAYMPRRRPTVEEAVQLCLLVDGDIPSR